MGRDFNDDAVKDLPKAAAGLLKSVKKAREPKGEIDALPGVVIREAKGAASPDEVARRRLLALHRTIDTSVVLPPLEEIAGLFPRGGLSFIASKPGIGKSWLVQKIASDLSLGGDILGGYVSSDPRVSIIFAGEAGHEWLIRRGTSTRWPVDMSRLHVIDAMEAEQAGLLLDIDTEEGK